MVQEIPQSDISYSMFQLHFKDPGGHDILTFFATQAVNSLTFEGAIFLSRVPNFLGVI